MQTLVSTKFYVLSSTQIEVYMTGVKKVGLLELGLG